MNNYIETKVGKYIVRKYNNEDKHWYLNGYLHREDGPAIKCADGYEAWYNNGECHRVNGPAIKWANGNQIHYLNGKYYSKQEYKLGNIPLKFIALMIH